MQEFRPREEYEVRSTLHLGHLLVMKHPILRSHLEVIRDIFAERAMDGDTLAAYFRDECDMRLKHVVYE